MDETESDLFCQKLYERLPVKTIYKNKSINWKSTLVLKAFAVIRFKQRNLRRALFIFQE